MEFLPVVDRGDGALSWMEFLLTVDCGDRALLNVIDLGDRELPPVAWLEFLLTLVDRGDRRVILSWLRLVLMVARGERRALPLFESLLMKGDDTFLFVTVAGDD
jgi:hypothetical protein